MFAHRSEKLHDRTIDVLTDEAAGLRIAVSRLGAELISLGRRNIAGQWVGFLYRDNDLTPPASGWANHATVMGFYLHRLKDGRSFYRGQEIKGGTHSFLRSKHWHLVDSGIEAGELTYRITPDDYSKTEYPLRVSLDLTYRLAGGQLETQFRFHNTEADLDAHVSFGLHPGFAATSLETFRFEMPPGKYRRYFSPGNYLSGETQDMTFEGGEMPFAREQLPGSYIIQLLDVPKSIFRFADPPSGRAVTLDLTGVPYVTLWSDGGPFLCVEPCWGLTDRQEQRPFEEKDGIEVIAPGGELSAHFRLAPRLTA
jgi:galactose mutarotase-like enzyme